MFPLEYQKIVKVCLFISTQYRHRTARQTDGFAKTISLCIHYSTL